MIDNINHTVTMLGIDSFEQSIKYDKSYNYLFKVLLIGDTGVGKSSLLTRYVENEYHHNYIATIGVDFRNKTIRSEGELAKLQLWDTAGQERFETINSTYYRGAHGILVCFDLTNNTSFTRVQHWLNTINNRVNTPPVIILVGLKNDLIVKRVVSRADAEMYAIKNKMPYFEASSKTGKGVDVSFNSLSKLMIKRSNEVRLESENNNYSREINTTNDGYSKVPLVEKIKKNGTNFKLDIDKKTSTLKSNCCGV